MSWLLKILASQGLRTGLALACKLIQIVETSIRSIIATGKITEETRTRLTAALVALTTVGDFVYRLAELFGAPVDVRAMSADGSEAEEIHAVNKLREIVNKL